MHCPTYYAHKDKYGFPIPGSMIGYKTGTSVVDCSPTNNKCSMFKLSTEPAVIDPGYTQKYHPNKLRFWVRIDCDGKMIPNSLFSTMGKHPGGNVVEQIKIICCDCPPSMYVNPAYVCNYVI